MTTITPDNLSLAIERRLGQLSPADQLLIIECAVILKDDIRNMGLTTAKEVLYQVGRLMAQAKNDDGVTRLVNPTIRRGE